MRGYRIGSAPDDRPFELRDAAEDMEDKPPAWSDPAGLLGFERIGGFTCPLDDGRSEHPIPQSSAYSAQCRRVSYRPIRLRVTKFRISPSRTSSTPIAPSSAGALRSTASRLYR